MATSAVPRVDAGARLDRLPAGNFHWRVFLLIAAGMFLDAFELYLAAGVLPSLVQSGFSTPAFNAYFVSSTFYGMVIGAWLAGVLGDHFGRRFSYQLNLAIFGLASITAYFAPNIETLVGLRFVMGIGLGAEIVVGYSTLAEFAPPGSRGRWVSLLAVITNLALFVSALTGRLVIPNFGWRYMFLIVGIAAVVVWLLRKSMPESPRWLESQGRFDEADAILRRAEQAAGIDLPPQPSVPVAAPESAPKVERVSFAVLFSRDVIRRTLVGMAIHVTVGIVVYGLVIWMPTFLVQQGVEIARSLTFTTVMSLGGPVGALIGLFLADWWGRKPTVVVFSLLTAAFGAAYPFVGTPELLMAVGFGLVTSLYTVIAVGFALLVPELFPTTYRFRGAGLCGAAGRIAAALVQSIVVAAYASGGVKLVIAIMVGVLLVEAAVVAAFGIETKQRRLEELAPFAG